MSNLITNEHVDSEGAKVTIEACEKEQYSCK